MKKDDWAYVSGARLKSARYGKSAEKALLSKDYKKAIKNYEEAAEVIAKVGAEIDTTRMSLPGLIASALKINKAIYLSKAENLKKKLKKKEGGLLKKLGFSLLFFIPSIFLLSSNITGNIISNLTHEISNIIGGILFICGLAYLLFYFKFH